MGSSGSRMKIALVPQLKPARATRTSVVSHEATSLRVDLTGMNTTFRVHDANNTVLVHDLQPTEGSTRRTLCSASGFSLLTMMRAAYDIYEGTDASVAPLFRITATLKPGFTVVVYADFRDQNGEPCRLLMEGMADDRVVLAYLERGASLAPILKEKNDRNPNVVAVGRIRRPKTDGIVFEGRETAFIEAEAGVDLSLMVLMWYVRYEVYYKSVVTRSFTHETRVGLQDGGDFGGDAF